MRFLWKSQLKKERGKFLPRTAEKSAVKRKERLESHQTRSFSSFGTLFLWLLFFGTVTYAAFFSSYLALAEWHVTGLSLVDEQAFRTTVDDELSFKYLGFIPRSGFFLIQPGKLERLLKERYPLVKNVTATRIFPDKLAISVEERDTILLWCVSGSCAHILEDGSAFPVTDAYREEENQSRTLTLLDESAEPIRYGPAVYDQAFVALTISLKAALEKRFGIATENEIRLSSRFANELRMKTKDGFEIYIGTRIPLETSLTALGLILEKELQKERLADLEYIDLRTENRVFYRFREGTEQPETAPAEEKAEEKKSKK